MGVIGVRAQYPDETRDNRYEPWFLQRKQLWLFVCVGDLGEGGQMSSQFGQG